jgi:phosphoribosylamine--glycine ligase
MGSYKDTGDILPFLTKTDRAKELEVADRIFQKWKGKDDSSLRGVPLYLAFMHSNKGLKILENNSRPGDPEIINILPVLEDDFVDVCFRMVEGNLTQIELRKAATVVTYKAPPSYAGFSENFPKRVDKAHVDKPVDLTGAYELSGRHPDQVRVYPGSMEKRDGKNFTLSSRTVCTVGIADSIEDARSISLDALEAIKGGALWYRTDVASTAHIKKSVSHLESLRRDL